MTQIALGDLYSQYIETGEWPAPREGVNMRRYLRDNNIGDHISFVCRRWRK